MQKRSSKRKKRRLWRVERLCCDRQVLSSIKDTPQLQPFLESYFYCRRADREVGAENPTSLSASGKRDDKLATYTETPSDTEPLSIKVTDICQSVVNGTSTASA